MGPRGDCCMISAATPPPPTQHDATDPPLKVVKTMKCALWTETPEVWRLKVPNSRFAPHDLCAIFRGPKKHINFFNLNFLAPIQKARVWTPRESLCASFPAKGRKKGTHINFSRGIFGPKRGSQTGYFRPQKSLVYCFFPPLNLGLWFAAYAPFIRQLFWHLSRQPPFLPASQFTVCISRFTRPRSPLTGEPIPQWQQHFSTICFCVFKSLLSWRFPRKTALFGWFSSLTPTPPPALSCRRHWLTQCQFRVVFWSVSSWAWVDCVSWLAIKLQVTTRNRLKIDSKTTDKRLDIDSLWGGDQWREDESGGVGCTAVAENLRRRKRRNSSQKATQQFTS